MKGFSNISLVQLNVEAGVDEYYLPKNVNWHDATISKILVVPAPVSMVSPVDGRHVLTAAELPDMYLDLYAADDSDITHALHYSQILYTNNHPFEVNSKLSLNLSRIYFSDVPETSGALLLYVFYHTCNASDEETSENITVTFPLHAGERLNFTDIVNRYMHANDRHVRRITSWQTSAPAFMTLRDVMGLLALNELSTLLFRPQINGGSAQATQLYPLALNNIDLDFDNCFIHNTTASDQQHVMTFEY